MSPGLEHERHLGNLLYALDTGLKVKHVISTIAEQTRSVCHIHGKGCLGHVEENGTEIFMPSTMTRSNPSNEHALMVAKSRRLQGKIGAEEYRSEVVKHMRSKTGYVRRMNSITVEGSLKMVISPDVHNDESTVSIPHHIASAIKVPHVRNGVVQTSCIEDGDYGILVRQPVLWHGGIRSCRIRVLDEPIHTGHGWDTLSSMKVPISMCSSFAADYDGDEMTLFPVKSPKAVQECRAALWDNSSEGPYARDDYNVIVPVKAPVVVNRSNTIALATTMCWTDRMKGHRATKIHSKWMTSASAMIAMKKDPPSPLEFARQSMEFMSSSTAKSSLQSNIGATSRRSKLGAERVFLDANGCIRCQSGTFSTLVARRDVSLPSPKDGYFGNPTVRAISKFCRASMQITLKVKSSTSVSDVSPTLSLLSGSTRWLRILRDGTIHIASEAHLGPYEAVDVTCSLFDVSMAPVTHRMRLLAVFINIVCVECRCTLDPAEYECLLCLMIFLVNTHLEPEYGIESNINRYYGEFHTVSRWNMCYANFRYYNSSALSLYPNTLVEHMMLGSLNQVPSIAHNMA